MLIMRTNHNRHSKKSVCGAVRPSVVFLQIEDAVCQGHPHTVGANLTDIVTDYSCRLTAAVTFPRPVPYRYICHRIHATAAVIIEVTEPFKKFIYRDREKIEP